MTIRRRLSGVIGGHWRLSRVVAGSVIASLLVIAAGCGGPAKTTAKAGSATTTTSSSTQKSANKGATKSTSSKGATIVAALGAQTNINWYLPIRPVAYSSVSVAEASGFMYKPLFLVGSNGQPDFARSIASSITWNKAGTVYTVKMNPKWHWSDGTPVTAQDVLFDWHILQITGSRTAPKPWPRSGSGPTSLTKVAKSMKVVDAHTFQLTLANPVNQVWFEINEMSQLTPLPSKAWNKYPTDLSKELAYLTTNGNNPAFYKVIDGPFRMVSAVQNSAWTFVPNPSYDGHKPSIAKLVLAYETSNQAEFNALRTGVVQVGYLPPSQYAARTQLTNDRFVSEPLSGLARTVLNFKNAQAGPILRQFPVRQAMQLGFDQQTIIKTLYHGLGVIGVGPVPETSPYLDPALKQPVYPFDLAKGKKVLEAAGWHMGSDGIMTNASGQKLSFTMIYPTGSTTTLAMVQIMQEDWGKEGIHVALRALPFATILQYHRQPSKWEIATGLNLSVGGYPINGPLYETNGANNFVAYHSAKLDQLINVALGPQASTAAATKTMNAYQEYVATYLPNLWGPVSDTLEEIAKNVHGVISSEPNPSERAIYPQYWVVTP